MNSKTNTQVIKILLVEDQEDDADLVRRALRKGGIVFEALRVEDGPGFEKALNDFKPDAILSDHFLPQFNSIEALRLRQQHAAEIPFILVTGAVSDEFAAQCIKLGADDYILKSNLSRLTASLKTAMEYHALERKRKQNEVELREQNVRLTKANKELDSFVYSVSHNLRAPLSSILGLVNVARHEVAEGKINFISYLDLIEQSIQRLDETIKEILEYSHNERTGIASENIDLQHMISNGLERIKYLPGFDRIEKQINITGQVPFVSDPYRVSVIVYNLVANAVKYYDEDKAQPYLWVNASLTPALTVIEVIDNGIGIKAKNLPLIFNMFYRGTTKSDGAGLGLYIVKEMLDKLGGTIVASSDFGFQSTFTITLPNGQPLKVKS